ncbi:MAG: SMR family transporter [Gammaproteobacteria bacterium]|nr:SMR family transporter [Gammaproteobacteria bacterium]MDD9896419.1 SMR family transporter [Gammaproteobacteria bacterium]MDD9959514.1 SMR family transporter [Gammaproteobacteria bacterium]
MKNWIFLLVAIISEVIGTSALKASEGFTVLIPSIIVVFGYSSAFYFLSLTLRSIPVGIAYAIWSGVGIALITLIGWVVFNQKLDVPAIIGILLIVAGVTVMYSFSESIAH